MTVVIRPASIKDAAAVYGAWQALRAHYANVDSRIQNVPVTEQEFASGLDEMLNRPGAVALLAEDGRRVVGFVSGGIERNQPDRLPERHATIGYLFVEPSARRRGVGRQLFEAVCTWAARQDGAVSHLEMPVLSADAESTAFWKSLGFSPFIQRLWAPLPGTGPDPKADA